MMPNDETPGLMSMLSRWVCSALLFLASLWEVPVMAGDGAGQGSLRVARVADLAALPQSGGPVLTDAFAERGDGGGGTFVWSTGSTEKANGITVVGGTSPYGRWIRSMDGALSIAACGARPRVKFDNTAVINACLEHAENIFIPDGDYYVSDVGINIPSNRTISFSPKARIVLLSSAKGSYNIFSIKDVENIVIRDPVIVGDKYTHKAKDGEWGMGIGIRGGRNISIISPVISRCWGDALYIGQGKTASEKVVVRAARLTDNRRQGISITSGKDIQIIDATITGTRSDNPGTTRLSNGPHAGIDIEPNHVSDEVGVYIVNLATAGNQGYGLIVSLRGAAKGLRKKKKISVVLDGHRDDGSRGGLLLGGWSISDTGFLDGNVVFRGQRYVNSQGAAIALTGYSVNMPVAVMEAPSIKDWGRAGSYNPRSSSAISIYDAAGIDEIGNVMITDPHIERTAPAPEWNGLVLYAKASTGKPVTKLQVTGAKIVGTKSRGIFPVDAVVSGITPKEN